VPQLVGSLDERDVGGRFGVGVPKNTGLAAVRAALVDMPELFEHERFLAASG
jgi:hypothetical protein